VPTCPGSLSRVGEYGLVSAIPISVMPYLSSKRCPFRLVRHYKKMMAQICGLPEMDSQCWNRGNGRAIDPETINLLSISKGNLQEDVLRITSFFYRLRLLLASLFHSYGDHTL